MASNFTSSIQRIKAGLKLGSTASSVAAPAQASRRAFLSKSTMLAVAGGSAAFLAGSLRNKAAADVTSDGYSIDLAGLRAYFRQIQAHENAHVATLVSVLGKNARPKPTFHNLTQDTMAQFIATSQALENTGVGAYNAATPYIDSATYLAAAASIAFIEARHSGFLNVIQSDPITGHASNLSDDENFEATLTIPQVVTNASPYIRSLNGGPALSFTTKKSAANDIAILNFALALEYLEADYYNINVRRFFDA